jgi:hypothetical protein
MRRLAAGLSVLGVALVTVAAVGQGHPAAKKAVPKPDLHAGGAKPTELLNHETTTVTLPGYHLTGTTVTVSGECTLKSYKVVSDSEITMEIEGNRGVDDKDDACYLQVHQGTYEAHTWVTVALTEDEQNEKSAKQKSEDQANGEAYVAHLGKEWTLHFADGSSDTFTAQPAASGELPDFVDSNGTTAKIATTDGGKVMVILGTCMRSGTLVDGRVKDGTAIGDCKPAGSWTAQMK